MPPATSLAPPSPLRRYLPLLVLAALVTLILAMGWHKLLTFKTIGLNYEALQGFIARHIVVALLLYVLAYVAIVAMSLPGALIMTLTGGLLFGWQLGTPATVVGATLGAIVIFMVARTSFGEGLAVKAGPWLVRLRDGFKENALNYLLFLRLVPVFPFVVVNLASALLGVPLRTYAIATFLGIIPGTTAYSFVGAGLGSVIEAQNKAYNACLAGMVGKSQAVIDAACPYTIDTSKLITKELVVAFVLLGLVALIPVALKKWRARHATAQ